ncbi:MAG: hypothetical protein ABIM30_00210 [candidate division WOR-3 bacterium]
MFFVPKGETSEVIFASNLSSAIKTHTVKVYINDSARYINIPCSSGASGALDCAFCREQERKPDYIFRPRKIYIATAYVKLNEPWTDDTGAKHLYARKLYVTSHSIKKNTIGPYLDKYGSINGAKFSIVRGMESKNFNGDIYNFIGFVKDITTAIGEKPKEYDPTILFSELTPQEIREIFTLIKIAEAKTSNVSTLTRDDLKSSSDDEIPF